MSFTHRLDEQGMVIGKGTVEGFTCQHVGTYGLEKILVGKNHKGQEWDSPSVCVYTTDTDDACRFTELVPFAERLVKGTLYLRTGVTVIPVTSEVAKSAGPIEHVGPKL